MPVLETLQWIYSYTCVQKVVSFLKSFKNFANFPTADEFLTTTLSFFRKTEDFPGTISVIVSECVSDRERERNPVHTVTHWPSHSSCKPRAPLKNILTWASDNDMNKKVYHSILTQTQRVRRTSCPLAKNIVNSRITSNPSISELLIL